MPYIKIKVCQWCHGTGRIYLKGHKSITCFYCHGIKIIGDNQYEIGNHKFRLNTGN